MNGSSQECRYLPKRTLEKFIECYKSHSCLWKIKSPEYTNRQMKHAAYQELIEICRKFHPNADRQFVIKKINSIKTAYRRELRKMKKFRQSGNSMDLLYKPALWYFPLLDFVRDQESPRSSDTSTIFVDENMELMYESNMLDETEFQIDTFEQDCKVETVKNPIAIVSSPEPSLAGSLSPARSPKSPKSQHSEPSKKREKSDRVPDSVFEQPYRQLLSKPQDEFDAIGFNVACKLRKMDPNQRLIAEFKINNILYRGMTKMLEDDE